MNRLKVLVSVVAVLAGLLASGCGNNDKSAPSGAGSSSVPEATSSTARSAAADAANAPASGRAVEITANDQMKFSVTEIRAKPGEALSVTLRNLGNTPKFSMGHNWCLFKKADVVDAFIQDAPQAAATDYIPASHQADLIAHTKLLGPKETDTVTFQAPTTPGHYPFICSFPGHYQVGMKGELIVE